MKVIAFNSSPHMEKGNTQLILDPFLEGMREAGADVELFYPKKLRIKPCEGDYHCMFKKPGRCFIKDDMQLLYPKLAQAEIWVFASPVYSSGLTSMMQNILERLCPLAEPFCVLYARSSGYSWREATRVSKMVLVSSCAFFELDNFEPLLMQLKTFCNHIGRNGLQTEFGGALLRPNGPGFRAMKKMGVPLDDIFDAAKEAGRQLIQEGAISPEILKIVSRSLTSQSKEEMVEMVNAYIRQRLDGIEKETQLLPDA